MITRTIVTAAAAAILLLAAPTLAEDAEDGRLTLTTERVVVFKDGHCLVVKKAVGRSDDAGEVFTEEVPDAAVLGSFWATPSEGRLLSMTAGVEDVEETTTEDVACSQYLELLAANVGKDAVVELEDGAKIQGTLREVLTRTNEQPTGPVPPWSSRRPYEPGIVGPETRSVAVISGSLFAISSADGDMVLPVSRVRGLTVKGMDFTIERTVTTASTRKRLTFRYEGGAADRTLRVMYFRPGVRWIPTYRIGLSKEGGDEKRATVRLQAEILNEAEDLVGVPFDLVVGVPNFRFKEVVSPLVLERALQNALAQAAPQLMGQQVLGGGSNAFQNRAGEWRGPDVYEAPSAGGDLSIPAEIAADRSQDLFVYSLPALTLRKGQRAAVPVFEAEVPYRDVYTWDLRLARNDVEGAPAGRDASPLSLSDNRVWHQVELTNGSDMPWTTGAAMLLEGAQPLGQELLTYTAAGGRVRVPVTVAIDLRGDFTEEETNRELNALQWMRNTYARIDKKGRITVRNFKREAVDVEVLCRLGGHADAATHDGEIVIGAFVQGDWQNYLGHPAVNNHSEVRFKLRIEPGKEASPEVEFHYFTRH